jgi:hypothetical protein
VVEEAVRLASSLAERATRDVRELTHELVDVGRASGEGSVSFLMTRLLELAGSVTGFVQELQHYELRRRDPLPVVGLVAGGPPVTVAVPAGTTEVTFAFLLENDLARSLDDVAIVGADDEPPAGPFRLGFDASNGAAAEGTATAADAGRVGLVVGRGSWLWGERRRVDGVVTVPPGLAAEATVRLGSVARVDHTERRAPGVIDVVVRPERPGTGPG